MAEGVNQEPRNKADVVFSNRSQVLHLIRLGVVLVTLGITPAPSHSGVHSAWTIKTIKLLFLALGIPSGYALAWGKEGEPCIVPGKIVEIVRAYISKQDP
jgi:hypothetical protein